MQPGWAGVGPRELLVRQASAEDPYELLDLLQTYVAGTDYRFTTKNTRYAAVRSFFMHNRCALPEDPSFKIHSTKPPIVARLTLSHVVDLARNANIRDRSIILVKWQSLLDNERMAYVGRCLAEEVVTQIKAGVHPVRLNLPGRKTNGRGYYTFIGGDAVKALVDYFEKERGWPKPGEPIWYKKSRNQEHEPFGATSFVFMWLRILRRAGLIPKRKGSHGAKYGYNAHEMRDIAKSLLHTQAKADGFDMDCAEFWLGHTVDKLGYDKFYNDNEYVKKQYLITEKYLNILTNPPESELVKEQAERMQMMEEKVARLTEILDRMQSTIPARQLPETASQHISR
ncbi:MAG: hypothetical protein V1857_06990 [archaeon]